MEYRSRPIGFLGRKRIESIRFRKINKFLSLQYIQHFKPLSFLSPCFLSPHSKSLPIWFKLLIHFLHYLEQGRMLGL